MLRLVPVALFVVIASRAIAATPSIPAVEREKMLGEFTAQIGVLNRSIENAPGDPTLYSRRGDRRLFLGRFAEAVDDFEKMIALNPALDAPHWRLGIAYHFAGQWAKSAKQFEKYHAYDGRDRENGIWKFLADVKTNGLEAAQRSMLPYMRFDREPFPSLYDMFAGAKSTDDVFGGIKERKLTADGAVMFFAHYYGGLNEELHGRRARALALLREAVASEWGRSAEGGPAYMWQVARLHYESLVERKP